MSIFGLAPRKKGEVSSRDLFDRVFDNALASFGRGFSDFSGFSPSLDVRETDKAYEIIVELPGLDEKEIDVSVEDDVLTIKGEKKVENEDKGDKYHVVERSYGSFSRSLRLPADVEVENLKANYKKGILTLDLPKSEKAQKQVKKIEVKS